MKRFRAKRPVLKTVLAVKNFICRHSAILLLLCLMLGGAFLGTSSFRILNDEYRQFTEVFIYKPLQTINWHNAFAAIVGSCLRHAILLVFLFLFGLTAFGCPLILSTVLLFGFRVSIMLCTTYVSDGLWSTMLTVYPPILPVGLAMLLAVRCSLHMSYVYSCQLLPYGANCGGLWSEFRHYLITYAICFGLIVFASIAEILLQIFNTMM